MMIAVSWASSARAASMSSLRGPISASRCDSRAYLASRLRHGQLSGVLREILLADRPGSLVQLLVAIVVGPGLASVASSGGGLGPRLGDLLRPRAVFELRQVRREIISLRHEPPAARPRNNACPESRPPGRLDGVSFVHRQRLDAAVDLEGEVDLAYVDISLELEVCLFFPLPNEDVPRSPGQCPQDQDGEQQPAPGPATCGQVPSPGRPRSRAALSWSGSPAASWPGSLRVRRSRRFRGFHRRLVSCNGAKVDHQFGFVSSAIKRMIKNVRDATSTVQLPECAEGMGAQKTPTRKKVHGGGGRSRDVELPITSISMLAHYDSGTLMSSCSFSSRI